MHRVEFVAKLGPHLGGRMPGERHDPVGNRPVPEDGRLVLRLGDASPEHVVGQGDRVQAFEPIP